MESNLQHLYWLESPSQYTSKMEIIGCRFFHQTLEQLLSLKGQNNVSPMSESSFPDAFDSDENDLAVRESPTLFV